MKYPPRPGVWGDEARPGEVIRVLASGAKVYNLGATFIPVTGENHRLRRKFRLE
jgi:hypothetical protein